MFDYRKSRPTLRHFTKGEIAHSPESLSFIHMVCSISIIVFSILHFSVLSMLGSVQQFVIVCTELTGMCVSFENVAVCTK